DQPVNPARDRLADPGERVELVEQVVEHRRHPIEGDQVVAGPRNWDCDTAAPGSELEDGLADTPFVRERSVPVDVVLLVGVLEVVEERIEVVIFGTTIEQLGEL